MSEEQLKSFLEKVKTDTSLQEKLKAEGADVVAIAKAAGFTITTEDLNYRRQYLTDDELEGMAGGMDTGAACVEWMSQVKPTCDCWLSTCSGDVGC